MTPETHRPLTVAVLAVALTAILDAAGCAQKALEYPFLVSGTVADAAGQPLGGVRVTLQIQGVVYDGTTPVQRTDTYTDDHGRYAFDLVTRDPTERFSLAFDKEGYESSSIEKTSLAETAHDARLTRIGS
jgi:hypothetical protein